MKIQIQEIKNPTQGILWNWEDRGNSLFTFLGGGASWQGADSRSRRETGHRMHNHYEDRGSSLGPGDTHS